MRRTRLRRSSRFGRRRSTYRRRSYRRRRYASRNDNKVYRFNQPFSKATVTANGSIQYFAYTFSLADLSQASSFDALFDQYRIRKIRFTCRPMQNVVDALNVSTNPVVSVIDYDGAGPSDYTSAANYQTQKITSPEQIHNRIFIPRVRREIYSSALSTGYETALPPWLDTLYTSIPHFGVHFIFPEGTSTNQTWIMEGRMYFECRNVR